MTAYFTEKYVRNLAETLGYNPDHIVPNCESAWGLRLRPQSAIPWKDIWSSLGTPLSDATEEKSYRRLLHRAINAKNRHPKNPDHACRLHCGETESMLHMIKCKHAIALWRKCLKFCKKALGEPAQDPIDPSYAIILGVHRPTMKLLTEPTRAFLRHAFGIYYRDVVNVAKHNVLFNVESTFNSAVQSFHRAALRYSFNIMLLSTRRTHTNLTEQVPEAIRLKYSSFLKVHANGSYEFTQTYTTEIQEAAQAAAKRVAQNTPPPRRTNP